MDVFVKWSDGTENIVLSSVSKSDSLAQRAEIKMYWKLSMQCGLLNKCSSGDH